MLSKLTTTQKLVVLLVAVALIVVAINYKTVAETVVGITLKTNPDLERGLVGHWTFDGADMTSNVADVSGGDNHGSLNGQAATTTVHGVIGQALEFDGANDYVEVEDDSSLDLSSSLTVGAWINAQSLKTSDVTQWDSLVTKGGDGETAADNHNFALAYNGHSGFGTVNRWVFLLENSSGSNCNLVGNAAASLNTWYHVVGVFDDDNNAIRIYVDGAEQNSGACSLTVNTNDLPVRFGDDQSSPGTPFDGTLDDVRIYNRALSADEVSRLYDLGKTTHVGTTINTNPDLNSGLVGHWTFDGPDMTSNVADRSGNGNDGRLVGQTATTTVRGVLGQALEFDGSDDYVFVADDASLDFGTGNFTAGLWVKTTTSARQTALSKFQYDGTGTSEQGFYIDVLASGTTRAAFESNGGDSYRIVNGTATMNDGRWHHIVLVRDAQNIANLYEDGVFISSNSLTSGTVTTIDTTNSLGIGYQADQGQAMNAFDVNFTGSIDDVRIYNRVLSAGEISRLYDLGQTTHINKTLDSNPDLNSGLVGHWTFDGKDMTSNVADASGQGNNGKLIGQAATTTVRGVLGQALEFDGSDDCVSAPINLSGTNVATAAFWMERTSFSDNDKLALEFSSNYNTDNAGGFIINPDSSSFGGGLFAVGHSRTGQASTHSETFARPSAGVWHHYVVVFDKASNPDSIDVWVDGVAQSMTTNLSINSTDNFANSTLYLMSRACSSLFGGNSLDDVRVYSRALSASEVQRLYQLGR